jgi:hypothetical protein
MCISRHCEEPKAMWQSRTDKKVSLAKQLTGKVEYYSAWIAALPLVVRNDVRGRLVSLLFY